jgi:hypothetical protein
MTLYYLSSRTVGKKTRFDSFSANVFTKFRRPTDDVVGRYVTVQGRSIFAFVALRSSCCTGHGTITNFGWEQLTMR